MGQATPYVATSFWPLPAAHLTSAESQIRRDLCNEVGLSGVSSRRGRRKQKRSFVLAPEAAADLGSLEDQGRDHLAMQAARSNRRGAVLFLTDHVVGNVSRDDEMTGDASQDVHVDVNGNVSHRNGATGFKSCSGPIGANAAHGRPVRISPAGTQREAWPSLVVSRASEQLP